MIPLMMLGAFGQSPANRPSFEVAAIKPGNPAARQLRTQISSGGRLSAENVTLRTLIEDAYQLKPFQLAGGPRWMDSDKFAVQAKGEDSAGNDQVRLMLQSLLAERFHLAMHREQKEQTIYTLLVKGKPKLEAATEGRPPTFSTSTSGRGATSNRVVFKNTSMARLADMLARQLNGMVVDQTGLSGEFDFELDATREENEPNPFVAPWSPALPQIGLKLETKKAAVEIFIVDGAEKPSEN